MKRTIFIMMTLLMLGAGCKGGCGSSDTEYNVNEISEDNAEETADKVLKDLDQL